MFLIFVSFYIKSNILYIQGDQKVCTLLVLNETIQENYCLYIQTPEISYDIECTCIKLFDNPVYFLFLIGLDEY